MFRKPIITGNPDGFSIIRQVCVQNSGGTSNEFMDEIINIHMELFSKDELTELNTLLEAKVMMKYRQVTPQIMNGLQQVALKLMKKHASELQSRLKNEVEK